jgi:CheY-like chemotaxis protein
VSVGQTVLVVEDDEELRSLLGRGLLEEGFVVVAVGTGADALARVGQTDRLA